MLPSLRFVRRLIALLSITLLGLFAAAPPAQAHSDGTFPIRIALPNAFQPEGITTGRGTTLFAGSLANGAIWRGDARTGTGSVIVPGIAGRVAVGVDHESAANRLWVAGGPTGAVTVYNAETGAELARYVIPGSGFLNDLVITPTAVYVTDSMVQRLVVIPYGPGRSLPTQAQVRTLPLTGDIAYVAGFNANGIVSALGSRYLILVQTATSTLFRVDSVTGRTKRITLTGGTLAGGDGLEMRGRTLYVVRGAPNAVVKVRLDNRLRSGEIVGSMTRQGLDVPTTGTFVAGRLYVVNARFGTAPGPNVEYWITRLPRG